MRTMLLAMMVLTTLAGTVGCQNKNQAAKNGGVLDVTGAGPAPVAPREPELAYAAPTSTTPAYYDTSLTQTPGSAGANAGAGGAYMVKKGDTLFSIAKANYGNGNQWQKIAGANPGLSPTTLKAGQRIVIP